MREGWTYKKLGEVCDVLDSQRRPVTKRDRRNGKYPYYGASGVQDYVDSYIFDGRYLIVGEDGAKWGASDKSAYIIEGKCWVNNHAHILKVKHEIIDKLLEYYLCFEDLSIYITGAIVPKLTQKALVNIDVPVPSLQEQQQIVSELDLLSSVIEKQKAQIEELDKLAQSIFYDMFGDPVENEKGWEVKKLEDITSKIGSGATPRGGNQSYKDEGISLIRSLNVHNNAFIFSDLAYIDDEQAKSLNNVKVEKDDVLLNITGASVARCCIVPNIVLPARVNQHVCILRAKKDMVNHIYLNRYLTSKEEQAELLSLSKAKAATREALPKSTVDKILVSLPPLFLQQEFANKIEAIESMKAKVRQSLKESEMLFNSRMDFYFS